MPTYFSFQGIKIQLFHNDHAPPHFHAVSAEYELVVAIKTLEVMQGKMPNKKRKLVLIWAEVNQDVLLELWDALQTETKK
jgi:hypothetical protein